MLPFHWGLLSVALLIGFSHGASINSAVNDVNVEYNNEIRRSKRSYKRGQTQSQYLNFGQPELDGKAEAEATEGGSKSTVSGTHGMGQAQSQFSSGDCSGCGVGSPLYEYSTGSPDPLTLGGNVISYSDSKPSSMIGLTGTIPSGALGPIGGTGGTFVPGAGVAGQVAKPGYAPGPVDATHLRKPGDSGAYSPGTSDLGYIGRPSTASTFVPGSAFTPGTGGASQIGLPSPGSGYVPGSAYAPGISDGRRIGKTSTGGPYVSGTSDLGQIGRPGTGGAYVPGTGGAPQIGIPSAGSGYVPGSAYVPGIGDAGRIGRPSTGGAYVPGIGDAGQIGRPGAATGYSPGTAYAPAPGDARQIGGPGSYSTNGAYPPVSGGSGQIDRPGSGGSYGPSIPGARQIGTTFIPSYGSAAGGTDSAKQGVPGIDKPGVSGIAQQSHGRPQLIAPPAVPGQAQVQQPGTVFDSQIPSYGQGAGQQTPTYTPGVRYTQPGKAEQVPQYGTGGQQLPAYGTDGQQTPSYGQQGVGSHIPGTRFTQPGSGFTPGQQQIPQYSTGQQNIGYPQQPGYTSGYLGPGARDGGNRPGAAIQPGTQYPATGPQLNLQQPDAGIIPKPGEGGFPQGQISGVGSGIGIGQQPGYRTQPSISYGQPGTGIQSGVGTGYQSGAGGISQGHIQPGGGIKEPGSSIGLPSYGQEDRIGYGQPGTGIQSGAGTQQGIAQPGGGIIQPGSSIGQPSYGPQGSVQPETRYGHPGAATFATPGSGLQPGTAFIQPGGSIQPDITYGQPSTGGRTFSGSGVGPVANLNQRGVSYQPGQESIGSQSGRPGTGIQNIPSGVQISGYTPGYVQQGDAGYAPRTPYGQPSATSQNGFVPQTTGTLPGLQQSGQPGFGVQPGVDYGQQIGQQTVVQPGPGTGQYPQAGFPQPSPDFTQQVPGGAQQGTSVQQGTGIQGSGYGTGYGITPGQHAGVLPGSGYGHPSTGTPYGQHVYGGQDTGLQPGVGAGQFGGVGTQLPGTGVQDTYREPSGAGSTQYGQGPQQIAQPSTSYIPSGVLPAGVHQGFTGPGDLATGISGTDDAFSQAESSIGNGQASANAQGKKNGGTAKTQVQGTYSSSGSFSASAMTSDNDRSASSQVTGGAEGAMSQSQGQGGAAQSQAQVQINEKTGGTKASSQSGGLIHQSQSEVQANDKGGLADAQSSGPGQTSSQAQIGFKPGQDGEIVRSVGGGQASAQSGIHSGNSQSQIQGTSKYGVSYHGAAQSASGTKEQVATYREQNRDLFNTISQFGNTYAVTDRVDTVYNSGLTPESDIPDLQLKASRTNKEVANSNKLDDDSVLPDEDEEEEPYDEYEDEEDYYNENPIKMESKTDGVKKLDSSSLYRTHTQTSPTQTQQIAVADPTKKYSVVQNQNGRVQTYSSRTTTETVPSGFRGTVNIEKKFHTKSLEPHKSENKLNTTTDEKLEHKPRTPDSFVTVTKSITGSMDNSKNPPQDNKNFQSTFYTKSSTCGYFTFSCNIVYGANGRSKICRPKAPTNGKC